MTERPPSGVVRRAPDLRHASRLWRPSVAAKFEERGGVSGGETKIFQERGEDAPGEVGFTRESPGGWRKASGADEELPPASEQELGVEGASQPACRLQQERLPSR